MTRQIAMLMYHELEIPGRELCRPDPGYVRYVVAASDLRLQLARLRASGFRGVSVGELLAGDAGGAPCVAITFDDGCETDLLVALPALREHGFNATSYVTVEHLGRRGYLTGQQLRELADLGCEIGSHGMTHRFLSDLPVTEIHAELTGSRERLEQIVQRPVVHFSCPGGRWDRRVAEAASAAGYASVATSRIGINSPPFEMYRLRRVAVLRGVDPDEVVRVASARGLAGRQVWGNLLAVAKGLIGNRAYEGLRSVVLGRPGRGAE